MVSFTVTFNIEGGEVRTVQIPGETSLLEAARKADVALDAPCGGNGTCGKCRVKILSGGVVRDEGPSRHIRAADYAQGFRLACQSRVHSDLEILVPAGALAYQTRIKIADLTVTRDREIFAGLRKSLAEMELGGDLGLSVVSAGLSAPDLGDAEADRERLIRQVAELTGAAEGDITVGLHALRKLPALLRESNFTLDCVIRRRGEKLAILNLYPASHNGSSRAPLSFSDTPPPRLAGLAIDIGTTTVSIMLLDLETGEMAALGSAGNGQIRYGADVINRIIESARPGGLERLRTAVTGECIEPLIRRICERAGISPDRIYRVAVAANTTMTHFFLGVPGEHIRLEPYVPAFFHIDTLSGESLGMGVHPGAEVLIAPGIGSYVGGDITAGVFSSMIFRKAGPSLLIDLGTNGELVFGGSDFLMACACSAGPAFEGGDISCGMRATDGAIEAVTVDPETMIPALSIVGADQGWKALGLCGSGLIDLIGELFRCGIINAKGKFIREDPGPRPRVLHDEYGGGRYIAAFPGESASGAEIALTETDIDNFIRAKGAIFSAIKTMLAVVDYPVDAIEDVYVAGGIGSGINMKNAIRIGMLPNLPLERYHYIGNSSLMGAYAMACSREAARLVNETGRGITYLELSSHPGYMDEFVAACFLPHTDSGLFVLSA
ncbi:MAG: ASKHA domain-containing protein [Spirochaetaceae bacterium]|jgi:uncharacterized 2Fe-2S/4Fe-4S cluster protein (DUF4445 family)|nr:ASKHA domain-containing protein [Spirochaetaceae bacterium]